MLDFLTQTFPQLYSFALVVTYISACHTSHQLLHRHWNGTATSLAGRFEELVVHLYERGYLELADVHLTQHWIAALDVVGYKFPSLSANHLRVEDSARVSRHATAKLPGSTGQMVCSVLGTEYDCTSLLDWEYYAQQQQSAGINTSAHAMQHWLSTGVAQGSRIHGGKRVLKIVLMTKDAWPLVKSWVLYHAHVFGGENLYIVDGSSKGSPSYTWLQQSTGHLRTHVFPSGNMSLDGVNAVIQELLSNLRHSADFLIKMDTDEFLGVSQSPDSALCSVHNCSLPGVAVGTAVRDYLDNLVVKDGKLLRIQHTMYSIPAQTCAINPALTTAFSHLYHDDGSTFMFGKDTTIRATRKTFFVAPTFKSVDLGGHFGNLQPQYNGGAQMAELVLIHLHYTCYAEELANTWHVMVAHGYLDGNMSSAVQLARCDKELANVGTSAHKIHFYCGHLKDPVANEESYLNTFRMVPNWKFSGLAQLVTQLGDAYAA